MRNLYRYKEAAEKFYGGDEESLRHALLLGVVRARVEACDRGEWAWWVEGDDQSANPKAGRSDEAQWRPVPGPGTYELTGWFYLDRSRASKLAHGRMVSDLLLSVSEDEERFLGLTFRVGKLVDLNDLWFEPSAYPDRVMMPEDETLDRMAEGISILTSDPAIIARFEAASNAGAEGLDFSSLNALVGEFNMLAHIALMRVTANAVREQQRLERSKGGLAKAANAKPNPEKAQAIDLKRQHPELSAVQIKTRCKLRASERTIRGWLAEAC